MIEMFVFGIAQDQKTHMPILVLYDSTKRRALPIWIGEAEANSITRALGKHKPSRPMTHDLLLNTINSLGFRVDHIEINELASDTYFATIFIKSLDGKKETRAIDSRPSDAIALALRAKAPIMVSAQVITDGTVAADHEKDEEEAQEFKRFVDGLKASDFKTSGGGQD